MSDTYCFVHIIKIYFSYLGIQLFFHRILIQMLQLLKTKNSKPHSSKLHQQRNSSLLLQVIDDINISRDIQNKELTCSWQDHS